MTMRAEDGERFHPGSRAEWRAWLAEHHDRSDGVWLVLWRQRSGRIGPTYEEAVQEALCFGWIDGKAAGLAALPRARERWDGLPRSARRSALVWITQAKRPETHATRVAETARLTAAGQRPAPD